MVPSRRGRRGSSCHTRDVSLIELDGSKTSPSVFLASRRGLALSLASSRDNEGIFFSSVRRGAAGALTVRAMGCRHRRVKKAVAAINRARSSGDREAVRQAVDRAKRLNPGQRDSERELRGLTSSARGGAGTSRTVRARNPTGEESHGEGACAREGGLYVTPAVNREVRDAGTTDTSRPRARTPEILATANVGGAPTRVLMPDGGSCVAVKDDESVRAR